MCIKKSVHSVIQLLQQWESERVQNIVGQTSENTR